MRLSPKSLLVLCLVLAACKSASSNPLIGTWISSDQPIPSGCSSKFIFTDKTMYFESPGIPNLVPASSGTIRIDYGGSPSTPNQLVVQNLETGVADDWQLTDAKHAISGATAQCHYVKQ